MNYGQDIAIDFPGHLQLSLKEIQQHIENMPVDTAMSQQDIDLITSINSGELKKMSQQEKERDQENE